MVDTKYPQIKYLFNEQESNSALMLITGKYQIFTQNLLRARYFLSHFAYINSFNPQTTGVSRCQYAHMTHENTRTKRG